MQPDGRFYADEDDFGWKPDEKIRMKTKMDRNGNFIELFVKRAPGRKGKL